MNFYYKLKHRIKSLLNKKINIVFVCHRPEIWASLKSIFDNCVKDDKFNVTIVTIPNKKQLPDKNLNHEIYESEGAEEFFKNYPCKVINGYNYDTKEWLDLKKLKPDYLFFQTPYNCTRPKIYSSKKVSKYTKIGYVHYGILIFKGEVEESVYPVDFLKYVSHVFTETEEQKNVIKSKCSAKTSVILTGYSRFDDLRNYKIKNYDNWNFKENNNKFRIIWTPRWTTNENNCHFFDYKDKLIEYVKSNQDIDFIFRPHPQAFLEWNATGEFTEKEASEYKQKYELIKNAKIDTQQDYFSTFYSSDLLITDISSIIVDYYLTEKPIIYCHRTNHFNDFGLKISEGFYWVKNWEDLKNTIEMLKSGDDPLKEIRKKIIKDCFYINSQGAGYTIKELIKKDFKKY